MKKIKTIIFAALMAVVASGCSDDEVYEQGQPGSLTVTLAVPRSASQPESRSDYAASTDECRINDLRFIAFPQEGKGQLMNVPMSIPGTGEVTVQSRINDIAPGSYRVYIIANMGGKVTSVTTEEELKQVIINYGTSAAPQLPQAGNLPMIYEPQSIITIDGNAAELTASLSFACVKIALNVIFDKASTPSAAAIYGDKGLRITGVTAKHVSVNSPLVNLKRIVDGSYDTPLAAGTHYATYTRTEGNVSADDADVMGGFESAFTPADPSAKWCYHQVIYLPERYVSSSPQQSTLELTGEIYGADGSAVASNSFGIELGHDVGGVRTLPRDTYYEIIGTVKSLGTAVMATDVAVKSWGQVAIDASIRHTLLSVDKTRANVTSLQSDEVYYTSSASTVEFECIAPMLQGKPVIVADHDATARKFTLRVNPGIEIASLPTAQQEGDAVVRLKANNIVKYVDVHYNIKPFFTVDYEELEVVWTEMPTKFVTVTTNLGGIRYPSGFDNYLRGGQARVKVQEQKIADGVWRLTLTLETDPVTTTELPLKIGPNSSVYYTSEFIHDIRVIAKPVPNKYRIYMRAINDRFTGTWPGTDVLADILTENDSHSAGSSSANWKDGWSKNDALDASQHYLYVYYQLGENSGVIAEHNVWRFSAAYPGNRMTADNLNPGWYYSDYSLTAQAGNTTKPSKVQIEPGKTLLIFSCNYDTDRGYTRHRFPHHMDPGITLFNYEDYEGWYLYDPTCEPYYRIYDTKPVIEDVTYTVYAKGAVTKWENVYGVADHYDTTKRYTVSSTNISSSSAGGGWYKSTFRLKAPKGEYEKAIKLTINGVGSKPMLFGGNSWKEGYFDGSTWRSGKPSGVN